MDFVYQPEGVADADAKRWPFRPRKLPNGDAELLEQVTGIRFPEWVVEVQNGNMTALHGLLWLMKRRDNSTLRYDQVVFCYDDVDFVIDDDDRRRMVAQLVADRRDRPLSAEETKALAEYVAVVGWPDGEGPDGPDSTEHEGQQAPNS